MQRVALGLLAAREHSREELARKLLARGFAADAVDGAIESLVNAGLIDEDRLADAYVSERLRKGFGPLRIREELRAKGLSDERIAPHIHLAQQDLLRRVAAAHDKRFGPGAPADAKERARRVRFLEQRGFPLDLVSRYLRGGAED